MRRTVRVWHIYLILPWDGDAASVEPTVECVIARIKIYTFHCGELLNVQHIFAVDSTGLQNEINNTVLQAVQLTG